MYIWTAINVESQLEEMKDRVKEIEASVDFRESNITLPLHVSLKISASVADELSEAVVSDLVSFFQSVEPFSIETDRIELHDTICWLKMKENESLKTLHSRLDQLFLEKYKVPRHEFDKNFTFHSTLFLDGDSAKVKQAFLEIRDKAFPSILRADRFMIGTSPEGKIGTYRVLKEIVK